jgi:hypothetical protein
MLNDNHNNIIILYTFSLLSLITLFKYYFNEPEKPVYIKYRDILYGTKSFITVKNKKYNLTYEEINWIGIKNISKYCIDRGIPMENFIDLGCGNGKTLVYAIQNGFTNAKGTEIVQDKYNNAINAREKMDSYMKDKIKLSNNDMFELKPDYFPPDSVIFINNLTFSESTNQELIKHLSKVTPNGIIVILSKIPNNLYKFKLIEQLVVPMSCNSKSKCHIIKK